MNDLDETAMKNLLAGARRGWSPNAGDAERVRRGVALAQGGAAPAPPARGTPPWVGRILLTAAFTAAGAAGGYWAGRRAGSDRSPAVAVAMQAPAPSPRAVAASPPMPPAAPTVAPPVRAPVPRASDRSHHLSVAAPASPKLAESLAVEVRALRNAERALRARNPGLASAFLDDLDRAVPGGQMREERSALRTIARCAAGQQPFGIDLGDEFAASYPSSAYRARVEQACGTDSRGLGD